MALHGREGLSHARLCFAVTPSSQGWVDDICVDITQPVVFHPVLLTPIDSTNLAVEGPWQLEARTCSTNLYWLAKAGLAKAGLAKVEGQH